MTKKDKRNAKRCERRKRKKLGMLTTQPNYHISCEAFTAVVSIAKMIGDKRAWLSKTQEGPQARAA